MGVWPEMDAGPCIDHETLAALIDRRLAPGEHDRAAAHVASCASCHELFLESAHTAGDGRTRSVPRLPVPLIALATAAAIVAAVSVAVREAAPPIPAARVAVQPPVASRMAEDPVQRLYTAGDAAALAAAAWPDDALALGFGATRDAAAEALLAGVRLTDLEVAVLAGDGRRARSVTLALRDALRDDRHGQLREVMRDRAVDTALLAEVKRALADDPDHELITFGRWLEAARLSAVVRSRSFWSDETRHALSRPPAGLPHRAADRLQETLRIAPPRTDAQWERLEAGLSDVLLLL